MKRAHVVLFILAAASLFAACGGTRVHPHGPPPEYEEPESAPAAPTVNDAGVG